MRWLDRFLDTYHKRVFIVYSLLMIAFMVLMVGEICIGYLFIHVNSTEQLYACLSSNSITQSFTYRLVVNFLNYAYTDHGWYQMIKGTCRFLDVLVILGTLVFGWCKEKDYPYFSKQVRTTFLVEIILIGMFVVGCISCFNASTLAEALRMANIVSVIYAMTQTLCLLFTFSWIYWNVYHHMFEVNASMKELQDDI